MSSQIVLHPVTQSAYLPLLTRKSVSPQICRLALVSHHRINDVTWGAFWKVPLPSVRFLLSACPAPAPQHGISSCLVKSKSGLETMSLELPWWLCG